MQANFKVLLATAAVLPLSACASFPLFHSAHAESASALARADASNDTYTELGRQQLDKGQTGAAIDSFRVAIAMGESPAAALNGLGVAYARLGRNDAAATLFSKAALLDPTNERYARNLARVDATRQAALAQAEETAVPAALAIPATQPELRPGQVSRVSAQEVKVNAAPQPVTTGALPVVASRTPQVVPAAAKAKPATPAKALAAVDPRFKPLLRVALRPAAPQAHQGLRSTAFAMASRPQTPVTPAFVPLVRVQFADAAPARSKSKVVVIAER